MVRVPGKKAAHKERPKSREETPKEGRSYKTGLVAATKNLDTPCTAGQVQAAATGCRFGPVSPY
jgi:hypothetical protein